MGVALPAFYSYGQGKYASRSPLGDRRQPQTTHGGYVPVLIGSISYIMSYQDISSQNRFVGHCRATYII
jgi:hypothetical protein